MDSVIQSTNDNQAGGCVLHADDSGFSLVVMEEEEEGEGEEEEEGEEDCFQQLS